MKILVTGTAGFIGHHLVLKLSENDHEIIGIDEINDYYDVQLKIDRLQEQGINNFEDGKEESKNKKNYSFIKLSLEDENAIKNLFKEEQFDVVVHLAAQAGVRYSIENPRSYINRNIEGFFNILEACREFDIRHLVYASSSSVYGNSLEVPFLETQQVDKPISLYAATKKSNELMAHTYSHLYGFKTTGLRFFTVYGPWGRPDMAPILFANWITEGSPIKVFNHGKSKRDFTYVDDIVEGVLRVSTDTKFDGAYNIYNIGNGSPVGLMDFIQTMQDAFNKETELVMMDAQPGDVEITYADTTKLENDYGYKPKTDLKAGIQKFADWYKSYYLNN